MDRLFQNFQTLQLVTASESYSSRDIRQSFSSGEDSDDQFGYEKMDKDEIEELYLESIGQSNVTLGSIDLLKNSIGKFLSNQSNQEIYNYIYFLRNRLKANILSYLVEDEENEEGDKIYELYNKALSSSNEIDELSSIVRIFEYIPNQYWGYVDYKPKIDDVISKAEESVKLTFLDSDYYEAYNIWVNNPYNDEGVYIFLKYYYVAINKGLLEVPFNFVSDGLHDTQFEILNNVFNEER